MIKLQVIGHLGKDATVNSVGGNNVINFSVCHTEKYKDAQGVQKEKSIWVECGKWGENTGVAPYLKKGVQVYVEGSPDIRTYTTAGGQQGASLSLRVQSIQLLGGGQNNGQQPQQTQTYTPQASYSNAQQNSGGYADPIDNLPF